MNSTTLRGIFPEPRPVCKRNFIKENVRHIKQMQGILPSSDIFETKNSQERCRPKLLKSEAPYRSLHVLKQSQSQSQPQPLPNLKLQKNVKKKPNELSKSKDKTKAELLQIKPHISLPLESTEKYSHRGVQTDKPEDIQKLYKTGNVKYPSASVIKSLSSKKNVNRKVQENFIEFDRGDTNRIFSGFQDDNISNDLQTLDINDKHDFIKENILALKQKTQRQDLNESTNKSQLHQRGVLPKYLRDRKEEQKKEMEEDPDCPTGHVLLPEDERKETLRVLRQSYADRIQELNSMPVRNDTLKMRKRKMDIEEELKKIDEGIKVFQRPKVFVKINA